QKAHNRENCAQGDSPCYGGGGRAAKSTREAGEGAGCKRSTSSRSSAARRQRPCCETSTGYGRQSARTTASRRRPPGTCANAGSISCARSRTVSAHEKAPPERGLWLSCLRMWAISGEFL